MFLLELLLEVIVGLVGSIVLGIAEALLEGLVVAVAEQSAGDEPGLLRNAPGPKLAVAILLGLVAGGISLKAQPVHLAHGPVQVVAVWTAVPLAAAGVLALLDRLIHGPGRSARHALVVGAVFGCVSLAVRLLLPLDW